MLQHNSAIRTAIESVMLKHNLRHYATAPIAQSAREVDESLLHVGVRQLHANPTPDADALENHAPAALPRADQEGGPTCPWQPHR